MDLLWGVIMDGWAWELDPWPTQEHVSPWLHTWYAGASGYHISSSAWEGFCSLLHMTAWLRNCGEQPCPRNLRQRFYATSSHSETVGMTSVEKKGNIDKTFMEVQHRPVFKSSLCPTATSTWREGVWGGKNGPEVQGQGRYTNADTRVPALPPTALLHLNEEQHASTYLGHNKHPKRLRWANTWQHKEVLCNERVRGSNWSHSTA